LKEKQFWNQILELAKERLTRSMFDFYATPAELIKVEGNVATIFLPRSEMEMVWSTKLNDIIVAVGFQIYDTEIKAQYVLTKEDSNTSDIASNVENSNHQQEEINLGLEDNDFDNDINPLETTGAYLSPKEFKEALLDENTVVLDTRNDYEFDLGHFRGAIRPDIRNFRELPQWVRDNKEKFMDKRVVVYCTGGVRCEKFSGWMVREGYKDVGQLHGGIATYGKDPEVQGELWDGKMYVFDERIAVDINHVNPVVIGKDWFDGTPCERYVNCANPECNRQILTSEENEAKYIGGCSHECRVHPRNRYVAAKGLTPAEVMERLAAIGEELPVQA